MTLFGICHCSRLPYPAQFFAFPRSDPANPRKNFWMPLPAVLPPDVPFIDEPIVPLDPTLVYRVDLRTGFLANSDADWFCERTRAALEVKFYLGPGLTPPIIEEDFSFHWESSLPDYLVHFPLTEGDGVSDITFVPSTAPDPPNYTFVQGYTVQRMRDRSVDGEPVAGRAFIADENFFEPPIDPTDPSYLDYQECFRRSELSLGTFQGQQYLMTPELTVWMFNRNPCSDFAQGEIVITREWLPHASEFNPEGGFPDGYNQCWFPPHTVAGLVDGRAFLLVKISMDPNFSPP